MFFFPFFLGSFSLPSLRTHYAHTTHTSTKTHTGRPEQTNNIPGHRPLVLRSCWSPALSAVLSSGLGAYKTNEQQKEEEKKRSGKERIQRCILIPERSGQIARGPDCRKQRQFFSFFFFLVSTVFFLLPVDVFYGPHGCGVGRGTLASRQQLRDPAVEAPGEAKNSSAAGFPVWPAASRCFRRSAEGVLSNNTLKEAAWPLLGPLGQPTQT